jgi:hypothetical protein
LAWRRAHADLKGLNHYAFADIGRIASVVKAVSDVLTFDEYLQASEAA